MWHALLRLSASMIVCYGVASGAVVFRLPLRLPFRLPFAYLSQAYPGVRCLYKSLRHNDIGHIRPLWGCRALLAAAAPVSGFEFHVQFLVAVHHIE